jgi:serine/threonine-protein kinase RsbT
VAQEIGFGIVDQTKIVTAASELARNTVVYGLGGEMRWETLQDGNRKGLRLHFVDHGPGIEDVSQALVDGWTSGRASGSGCRAPSGSSTSSKSTPHPAAARA